MGNFAALGPHQHADGSWHENIKCFPAVFHASANPDNNKMILSCILLTRW